MALYGVCKRINSLYKKAYLTAPFATKVAQQIDYKRCYQILEIPENSDQEHIRQAYLQLVKKHHPDGKDGNTEKFHEVDKAFKTLMDKKAKERWQVDDADDEADEPEIKHVAPQHRQYLSYGGMGSGTIYQRQKQFATLKAMHAAMNVMQHRLQKVAVEEKALMQKSKAAKHKIKTKYGYDRLVEDLIQEAMSKGEFSNLSGRGKPLKDVHSKHPYVDFTTHKINEILIENGFTPEWITLQKEIRNDLKVFRDGLYDERKTLGPVPLTPEEETDWDKILEKHKLLLLQVNKKISKFNLLVPVLTKQMILISMHKEAEKVLKLGKNKTQVCNEDDDDKKGDTAGGGHTSLFGLIEYLFDKK